MRFGKAIIKEDRHDGQMIGYCLECGRHDDADHPQGVPCVKHLAFGVKDQLSHEEVLRRLKIWYIMGANPAVMENWPAGEHRTSHIFKTGGQRLREFATGGELNPLSDWSDADLDDFCEQII